MTYPSEKRRPPHERRQHARVSDAVGLHIRRLVELPAAGDSGAADSGDAASGESLTVPARQPNKYDIPGYAAVRSDFPAVAEYIAGLEERIRQLLLDGDPGLAQPTHKVSLASDGLVFADDALLQPGELLGITLTLFPQQQRISTDCQVEPLDGLRAPAKSGEHVYRVRFLRINDADRLLLEQHVDTLLARLPNLDDDEP